ncbi:MAG: hypothetical protein GY855_14690 [candidate division Zixibacteria bacterium]|nr:hypothetical protein [candidate division Zixibacteria bacterium]
MKFNRLFIMTALFFIAFEAPVLAQSHSGSFVTGNINPIISLIWLFASMLGAIISMKVSKALKKGKLAIPWIIFTIAFFVFIVGSLFSFAQYMEIYEGMELAAGVSSALGLALLATAGYLYKKAILR